MANRLPVPGGDNGNWGQILNDYLSVELGTDGTLKNVARPSDVAAKYTKPGTGIPKADLSSAVQASLDNADAAAAASVADATTTTKGKLQLAGDLGGTSTSAAAPIISTGAISTGKLADGAVTNVKLDSAVVSSISAKATDASVVHLAGSETVTGAKNFTGGLTVGGSNVIVGSDSRLTDQRVPTDASVTDAKISAGGLTNAAIATNAGIVTTKLSTAAQTAIGLANTSVQTVNSKTPTSGAVTLTASDVSAVATSQLGASGGVATLTGTTLTPAQIPANVIVKSTSSADTGKAIDAYTGAPLTLPSGGSGGGLPTVATVVTTAGALATAKHTPVDATAGTLAMTLPTGQAAGTVISVSKYDTSINQVTITGNIDSVAGYTKVLRVRNDSMLFEADASGSWVIVVEHRAPVVDGVMGAKLFSGVTMFVGDSIVKQGGAATFSGIRSIGVTGSVGTSCWSAWAVLLSKGRIIFDGTHGVSGAQAAAIIGTQLEDILALPVADRPKTIVFGGFTNNAQGGATGTASLASAVTYTQQAIRRCRECGIRPVFVGVTPRTGSSAGNGVVDIAGPRAIDLAVSEICKANNVLFVPVRHLLSNADGTWKTGYSSDGLHPDSGEAAMIMGKALGDAVIKENWPTFALPDSQSQAAVISFTATTASGSTTLSGVSSTTSLSAGLPLYGTGIAAGATVVSFTSNTIVMSAAATASGTVTVTASPDGNILPNGLMAGGSSSAAPTGYTGGFGTFAGDQTVSTVADAPFARGNLITGSGGAAKNSPNSGLPIIGNHVIYGCRFHGTVGGTGSGQAVKLNFKGQGGGQQVYGTITMQGVTGLPASTPGVLVPDGSVWIARTKVPTGSTDTSFQWSITAQGTGDIANAGQLFAYDYDAQGVPAL